MRLLSERVAANAESPVNPLADVLLTEVLEEANRVLVAVDPAAGE